MKINVVCDFYGDSGYACHSRNLINALYKEGIDIAITCNRPQDWVRNISDEELKMLQSNPQDVDYNMFIMLPHIAKQFYCDDKPIIQYVVWEGDKIPLGWIDILKDERVKYILTPSNHTQQAILNTCKELESKIHVIPHGVNLDVFYPKPELKNKDEFVFFCDKGWPAGSKDRGGLSFLIKAFYEEFNNKDNVKLLVKINNAYGFNNEILQRNLNELKIQNKTPAKVEFILENIPYNKLNDIYNKANVFVIPSLAESFHIGGLQAFACGIPILYTTFGGQTDYCNEKNGWRLEKGKMIDISWDILYEGVKWKLPDTDEIRRELRYIYEHQDEAKQKSINALETAKLFTWKESAKKIKEIILNLF